MLPYYKIATAALSPFIPLWLRIRMQMGKEDRARFAERFGEASEERPEGKLLWIHAASVGESNSVLGLIRTLKKRFPALGILLTTGTVTSAALAKKQLPAGVLHHYAPIDTPDATERFVRHWYPDVVWFVESELWPNLIDASKRYFCLMALINARMSERSFATWKKYPNFAREILSSFRICFAQSEQDGARLKELGVGEVIEAGNLKYDAPPLPCNESELVALGKTLDGRKGWLAASTHPGEELLLAKTHARLAKDYPNLLTIIVPRHPHRGAEIASELTKSGKVALRSKEEPIAADTAFYIADTLGELGLFYRLSQIVFMGGSLVTQGGQNPLEPARLSCAILTGPHTHNFSDVYKDMQKAKAAMVIPDEEALAAEIKILFEQFSLLDALQTRAKQFVSEKGGASEAIIAMFAPIFAQ